MGKLSCWCALEGLVVSRVWLGWGWLSVMCLLWLDAQLLFVCCFVSYKTTQQELALKMWKCENVYPTRSTTSGSWLKGVGKHRIPPQPKQWILSHGQEKRANCLVDTFLVEKKIQCLVWESCSGMFGPLCPMWWQKWEAWSFGCGSRKMGWVMGKTWRQVVMAL